MQQRRWLDASTRMTQQLFAADSGRHLDLVTRHALRGADADFAAAVIPLGDSRARVETALASGAPTPAIELDLGSTFAGQVLRSGTPTLVENYDAVFPDTTRPAECQDGIRSVAGVPLASPDGRVWGALVVGRSADAPVFDEADLAQLAGFAAHAGLAAALDQGRTDREELLLLADHDRIAADLHDHVIQELFATGMGLQSLVPQARPEHQQRLLAHVDAIDATIRRIRLTIFRIQQRGEPDSSLRRRLLSVVDQERSALGIPVDLELTGPLDLGVPPTLVEDAVAVVREALSNVARHAAASRATVRVGLAEGMLTVEVIDDGVGIEPTGRSSGLGNLRRRAQLHGGTFELLIPPGGGAHLRWAAKVDPPT